MTIEITKLFRRINKSKQYTITTDNGTEFSENEFITKYIGMQVYFCHPNSPGEKGFNREYQLITYKIFP